MTNADLVSNRATPPGGVVMRQRRMPQWGALAASRLVPDFSGASGPRYLGHPAQLHPTPMGKCNCR